MQITFLIMWKQTDKNHKVILKKHKYIINKTLKVVTSKEFDIFKTVNDKNKTIPLSQIMLSPICYAISETFCPFNER